MADPDSPERTAVQENGERRDRVLEPEEETRSVTWRAIRFIELFFAVSCMASLMALYIMNPIYDDYTHFCEDLIKSLWSPKTRENHHPSPRTIYSKFFDDENELLPVPIFEINPEEMLSELTTKSSLPEFRRVLFRLSYAIVLFTLTTTVLMVLVLDLVSRLLGEPINKFPMIFMLAVSEILCLIIMVLSLDMFLGAINSMILAVSALALGLSICFTTDIVYTSVRGNG